MWTSSVCSADSPSRVLVCLDVDLVGLLRAKEKKSRRPRHQDETKEDTPDKAKKAESIRMWTVSRWSALERKKENKKSKAEAKKAEEIRMWIFSRGSAPERKQRRQRLESGAENSTKKPWFHTPLQKRAQCRKYQRGMWLTSGCFLKAKMRECD